MFPVFFFLLLVKDEHTRVLRSYALRIEERMYDDARRLLEEQQADEQVDLVPHPPNHNSIRISNNRLVSPAQMHLQELERKQSHIAHEHSALHQRNVELEAENRALQHALQQAQQANDNLHNSHAEALGEALGEGRRLASDRCDLIFNRTTLLFLPADLQQHQTFPPFKNSD